MNASIQVAKSAVGDKTADGDSQNGDEDWVLEGYSQNTGEGWVLVDWAKKWRCRGECLPFQLDTIVAVTIGLTMWS